MDSNSSPINKKLLITFKDCLQKVQDNSVQLTCLDNRLALTIEEMQKLSRIIYEGNGQRSLTDRVGKLEAMLEQIEKQLREQRKEDKEVCSRLQDQLEQVRKVATDLNEDFEEYHLTEKGKRDTADAKALVDYEWKLNAFWAVLLLLGTSLLGFLGNEMVGYWHTKYILKEQPTYTKPLDNK